jgi:hypothetical protein
MQSIYEEGLVVDILQAIVSLVESALKRFRAIQLCDDER